MFGFKPQQSKEVHPPAPQIPLVEPLEGRQLLSASPIHEHTAAIHASAKHKAVHTEKTHTKKTKTSDDNTSTTSSGSSTTTTSGSSGGVDMPFPWFGGGKTEDTITFSQAPTAVQTGLTSLASTDNQAAPTADQTVYLGNSNGVETYSLHDTSTGTTSTLTVDQDGNPVTKPTESTTTFADLTSSDAAAASEISAIATALNLTAPTDTTTINVSTTSAGAATYSVHLSGTSATTSTTDSASQAIRVIGHFSIGRDISVDASGNPVGDQQLPFDVLPTGIQSAINSNVPSGAATLATGSTQTVSVQTIDGLTLYSTTFDSTGTTSTITVSASGTPVSLPTHTTADFSTIPQAAQSELQTLATADGVTTTISSTQSVTVYTEANGTVIYSVSLSTSDSTGTTSSTSSVGGDFGDTITIAVDAAGNPTVPPGRGFGGGGGGGFGGGGGGGWGPGPIALSQGGA